MKSDTPETDNLSEKLHKQGSPPVVKAQEMMMLAKKMERERNLADDALKYAAIEIAELRHQIRETIMENLHLADGDDCTLLRLKDAISFELEDSSENAKDVAAAETGSQNNQTACSPSPRSAC